MIYFCLGRRLQGKTTLAYYIASRYPRRLIYDPRGQIRPKEVASSAIATTSMQLSNGVGYLHSGDLTEVVFTPDGNMKEGFAAFAACAKDLVRSTRTQCAILIDEIRFTNMDDESLDWILRCSPVNDVHIVLTGHRPKDIPTDIRSIADRWLLFKFTLPHDFAVIDEHTSPAVAQQVRRLQPRQFVDWDDATERCRVFKDPSVWYVPLGTNRSLVEQETLPKGEEIEGVDGDLPLE